MATRLQACVFRLIVEWPGHPLILDLHRVSFCDLAGLRSLGWLQEYCGSREADLEVVESESITRLRRTVDALHERGTLMRPT